MDGFGRLELMEVDTSKSIEDHFKIVQVCESKSHQNRSKIVLKITKSDSETIRIENNIKTLIH